MKCSESWLREWVNPNITCEQICSTLTMAGLEVESMVSVSELKSNTESLPLAANASRDEALETYLNSDDYIIDISVTPNRGDCLSVRGIAREISALTQTQLTPVSIPEIATKFNNYFPITVKAKQDCPRYVARVIKNIKPDQISPVWLTERLRQSGIRSINPVVDVTNYVMLELGQPMHAFDLNCIHKEIIVRQSEQHEKITLLDGSEKQLDAKTLIIADAEKPLAIAGIMGGVDSSVTNLTTDILLESAFFNPKTIAKQRQQYQLNSDSAYRFERGVDFTIQKEAIERASKLIIEIVGGEAESIIECVSPNDLPKQAVISIDTCKIEKILGIKITPDCILQYLTDLDFEVIQKEPWRVKAPPYRYDVTLPEDLIEEIARLYGYDNIPTHRLKGELGITTASNTKDWSDLRKKLSNSGYHEIISYSFIDKSLQDLLEPHQVIQELINPISNEMAVMRTNLWPGLIQTLRYNQSRQQQRIRLFEIGTCFIQQGNTLTQPLKLGGLATGSVYPEQWGLLTRNIDFYDVKGDIERLFSQSNELIFKSETHDCLHPGQTAGIYFQNYKLGIMGALHPKITQFLDIPNDVYVYEFDLAAVVDCAEFPCAFCG